MKLNSLLLASLAIAGSFSASHATQVRAMAWEGGYGWAKDRTTKMVDVRICTGRNTVGSLFEVTSASTVAETGYPSDYHTIYSPESFYAVLHEKNTERIEDIVHRMLAEGDDAMFNQILPYLDNETNIALFLVPLNKMRFFALGEITSRIKYLTCYDSHIEPLLERINYCEIIAHQVADVQARRLIGAHAAATTSDKKSLLPARPATSFSSVGFEDIDAW